MQREVVLTQVAEIQLNNTIEYIEISFGKSAKLKFTNKLENIVNIIKEYPKTFPISKYKNGVRRCVLSKQSTIYYKSSEEKITILAVFDNKQDPNKILEYIKNNKA